MLQSTAWDDLRLELAVLRALGARPLVWTMPLDGTYWDYTVWSAPARAAYYAQYRAVAAAAGVPALTFSAHDEDRYFMASPSHLSARGWVFADLAVDLFWHGEQLPAIQKALAALNQRLPVPPLPPPAPGGR